jgi:hypothetical protein
MKTTGRNELSYVLRGLLLGLALVGQQAPAASNALDREVEFNLPRQQVEYALLGFSEQAHVQVLTASTAIPDQQTAPVSGRMRIRAALDSILRDTGLGYSMAKDDTVTIQARKNAAGSATALGVVPTGAPLLATANHDRIMLAQSDYPTAAAHGGEIPVSRRAENEGVEEIVVTATKRGEETAESLPLSIAAISGQQLRDEGANRGDQRLEW